MKTGYFLIVAMITAMLACSPQEQTTSKQVPGLAVDAQLAAHSKRFAPGVEKVVDGVYVASGYDLANAVMIEGYDGLIIVDTMESMDTAGLGPFLDISATSRIGYLAPTVTFEDTLPAEVAGVHFELVHAPGETDDQLFVWLPDHGVLLCGDNFYWAFPNL